MAALSSYLSLLSWSPGHRPTVISVASYLCAVTHPVKQTANLFDDENLLCGVRRLRQAGRLQPLMEYLRDTDMHGNDPNASM